MADGDFKDLAHPDTSKKDDSLASMEAKLAKAEDARKEERFVWILVVLILLDCLIFMNMANATGPIVILTLQLVLLVVLAQRLGIDDVAVLLDRVLNTIDKK